MWGDFNIPGADWENLISIPRDKYREFTLSMIDIAGRHGLDQVVTEPKKIQGETENTEPTFHKNNPTLIN